MSIRVPFRYRHLDPEAFERGASDYDRNAMPLEFKLSDKSPSALAYGEGHTWACVETGEPK